jgi:HK97 family phage major capsid protein
MAIKSSKELRDERAVIEQAQMAIVKRAEEAGRDLDSDEMKQFTKHEEDFNRLTLEIANKEKIEQFKARGAAPIIDQTPQPGDNQMTDEERMERYEAIFMKYAKYGMNGLERSEIDIISQFSRGTGNQSTTSTEGGYTIPQGFSNRLQEEIALWGGMIANSYIFNTETGNPVKWPTVDDTAATGALLSETTTMPVNDLTFGQKELDAYTYTSGVVKVSRQLLQDGYFDLERFLRRAFARRLGTIMNAHFTTGTGSSQPNGVTTAASIGKVSAANNAVTRLELVDLAHSVDPAYRNNAKWTFNDTTLALIKKLSFGSSDARPLWQISMRDGEPDKLEGFPYFVNQDMDDFGANNLPIAFGDFDEYVIRMAGGTTFLRLDERYAPELMVGFLAYQRADAELIGANAIKTMRNPAT